MEREGGELCREVWHPAGFNTDKNTFHFLLQSMRRVFVGASPAFYNLINFYLF